VALAPLATGGIGWLLGRQGGGGADQEKKWWQARKEEEDGRRKKARRKELVVGQPTRARMPRPGVRHSISADQFDT
jgi:hypothetical protein